MSTRELLELASLDAMGLLDDEEREGFDSAFRAAPPEVQARVRKEQARFANADHLLPPVDPPAGLRARVISAVRDAIAAVRGEEQDVLATIGTASSAIRNTAPMWRAACIGFATASLVLGVMYLTVAQQSSKTQSIIQQDGLAQIIQDMGPRAQQILMSQRMRPVNFTPSAPDLHPSVTASLLFDPDSGEALLLCEGLPVADGTYTLTVRNGQAVITMSEIIATGGFVPVHVEGLSEASINGMTIEGPARAGGANETILMVGDV